MNHHRAPEPAPGLLDIIAAFFAAEREAEPGQVALGPCEREEPEIEIEP